MILGAEYTVVPEDTISFYYGQDNFGQRFDKQANGSYVGYGYPTGPNSQNKQIEEYSLATHTPSGRTRRTGPSS